MSKAADGGRVMFLRSNDFRGKERVRMGTEEEEIWVKGRPNLLSPPPFFFLWKQFSPLKNSLSVCFSSFRSEESSVL